MKLTWWRILLINTLCEWGFHRWGDWQSDIRGRHRVCKTCNLWQAEPE